MIKLKFITTALFAAILTFSACGGSDGGGTTDPGGNLPISSTSKTLTSFAIVTPASVGTIDETLKTVSIAVPYGTDVTNLIANFSTTGVSTTVNGVVQVSSTTANSFASPVIYTVKAEDNSTVAYTVTVTLSALPTTPGQTSAFNFTGVDNSDGTYSIYKIKRVTEVFDHIMAELYDNVLEQYLIFKDGKVFFFNKIDGKFYVVNEQMSTYSSAAGTITSTGKFTGQILAGTGSLYNFYVNSISFFEYEGWSLFELEKTLALSGDVTNATLAEMKVLNFKAQAAFYSKGTGDATINFTVKYTGSNPVSDKQHIGVILRKTDGSKEYGNAITSLNTSKQGTCSFTAIPAGSYNIFMYSSVRELMEIDSEDGDSYEIYNNAFWPGDNRDDNNYPAASTAINVTAGGTVNITDAEFDDTHKRDVSTGTPTKLVTLSEFSATPATLSESGSVNLSVRIVDSGIDGNINKVTINLIYGNYWQDLYTSPFTRTSGDATNGVYTGTINFSSINANGNFMPRIDISTDTGKSARYSLYPDTLNFEYEDSNNNWIENTGIPGTKVVHTAASPDLTGPVLSSFTVTDNGDNTLTFTLTTTDANSCLTGEHPADITVYHQNDTILDGEGGGWGNGYDFSLQATSTGVFSGTVNKTDISYTCNSTTYTTGTYKVGRFIVWDKANNRSDFYAYNYYNIGKYTRNPANGSAIITTAVSAVTFTR